MKGRTLYRYWGPLIVTTLIIISFSVFSLPLKIRAYPPENSGYSTNILMKKQVPQEPLPEKGLYSTPENTAVRPSSELLNKVTGLSPEARIPAVFEAAQNRFFCLNDPSRSTFDENLWHWIKDMDEYGISALRKKIEGNEHLFVRFATREELHFVYMLLALKIHEQTGLDPALIEHIIWKESRGNESAISHAGAIGITQTLPLVIRELLAEKKDSGNKEALQKKISALKVEIANIDKENKILHAQKIFAKKKFEALLLIPDFAISYPKFCEKPVAVPHSLCGYTKTLNSIEYLALMHGPLNLCFGMAHFAKYKATIEYYASLHTIDPNTEPLLAAQIAYNCGLSRLSKRIRSLGGWHRIFDITQTKNGRRDPYLPAEGTQ